MAISVKYRQQLTGGTSVSLDEIVSSELNSDDLAFTVYGDTIYAHKYDADSILAAASPDVIQPVDVPLTGRWILQISPFDAMLIPPAGTLMSGSPQGLNAFSNVAAPNHSIDATTGACYDSSGSTKLYLTVDTTAILTDDYPSPLADTVYNLFLTDAGELHFDTEHDGATLIGGGAKVQWVTFGLTGASGYFYPFRMIGNMYSYRVSMGTVVGSVLVAKDLTRFAPIIRVKNCGVFLNCNGTGTHLIFANNDVSNIVGKYIRSADDGGITAIVVPDGDNLYFYSVSGTAYLTSLLLNR